MYGYNSDWGITCDVALVVCKIISKVVNTINRYIYNLRIMVAILPYSIPVAILHGYYQA